jgi:hypothetical protein
MAGKLIVFAIGVSLLAVLSVRAEVIKGVMSVTGAEMK